MKTYKFLTFFVILSILFSLTLPIYATSAENAPSDDTSTTDLAGTEPVEASTGVGVFRTPVKAAYLLELNTGTELLALNIDDQLYPASLTKIMTCMLALEYGDVNAIVTVSQTALENLHADGSTAGLQAGEQISLLDLLYCLMIESANESANVVAEHISGSVDAFVELMNQTAADLGCTGTHFANPHGLHDENHYTTARDLSLITQKALEYDLFCTITNTPEYTVPATNLSEAREITTTNKLIAPGAANYYSYSKAAGIKTGFTTPAGRCLISTANDGNLHLLGIIMGAETVMGDNGEWVYRSFPECINLFEYGFNTFNYATVLSTLYPVAEVQVAQSASSQTVALAPSQEIRVLIETDYDPKSINLDIQLPSTTVNAPVQAGDVLGSVTVSYNGRILGTSDLTAITSIARSEITHQAEETKDYVVNNWWKWLVGILVGVIVALVLCMILLQVYRRQQRKRKVAARRRALEMQRRREHLSQYHMDDFREE